LLNKRAQSSQIKRKKKRKEKYKASDPRPHGLYLRDSDLDTTLLGEVILFYEKKE